MAVTSLMNGSENHFPHYLHIRQETLCAGRYRPRPPLSQIDAEVIINSSYVTLHCPRRDLAENCDNQHLKRVQQDVNSSMSRGDWLSRLVDIQVQKKGFA